LGPLRVLVVDDSAVTRALLLRTLSQAGFTTLEAADGAEGAVAALRELPDVVITDIEMPTMDGYQLLHLLKSDPATAGIPVLVLTSHGEAPSRYWGLHTGADSYITKDHAPAELIDTVQRLVALRPGRPHNTGPAPKGPLDVLARVARHLDANLFQATLANTLLERGVLADDFAAASEVAMVTVSEVADASVLAVGTAEAHAVTIHVLLKEPLEHAVVERFTARVLEHLEVLPGTAVEVIVHGDQSGGLPGDAATAFVMPLSLRGAGGALALLPRDPSAFAQVSRPLVERIAGTLALVLDNARLAERLRELSNLDSLTRILNHRTIHERLAEELERGRRYGHPVSIVLCDLDHFKRINDTHGHLTGDAVLRAASQAMRQHLRATDSFGRHGGEEFLIVLPETDLVAACQAAERLRVALEQRRCPLPSGGEVGVTGSFGVAARIELEGPVSADALVSLADQRLYAAKASGRNCVRP
jgi:two-component system, cell cycle response regulator